MKKIVLLFLICLLSCLVFGQKKIIVPMYQDPTDTTGNTVIPYGSKKIPQATVQSLPESLQNKPNLDDLYEANIESDGNFLIIQDGVVTVGPKIGNVTELDTPATVSGLRDVSVGGGSMTPNQVVSAINSATDKISIEKISLGTPDGESFLADDATLKRIPVYYIKDITILDSTTMVEGLTRTIGYTPFSIVMDSIVCVGAIDGYSVTPELHYGADRSADGDSLTIGECTSITAGDIVTFTTDTIPAKSWIWIRWDAVGVTLPSEFHISLVAHKGGTKTSVLPTITSDSTSLLFANTSVGYYSPEKIFTISGSSLTPAIDSITVTAAEGFEVSQTSSSGFAAAIKVAYTGGTLSAKSIYARLAPVGDSLYTGNITLSGGGASSVNIAVQGTGVSASSASFVSSLTQPTETGNQQITGVGFQPKAIIFYYNNATSDASGANNCVGFGVATSASSRFSIFSSDKDNTSPTATGRYHSNVRCISICDTSEALLIAADLVSMDADGFTINWTNVDATQRIINYVCLGGDDITNVATTTIVSSGTAGDQVVNGVGFQPDIVLLFNARVAGVPPGGTTTAQGSIGFGTDSTNSGTMSWYSADLQAVANAQHEQRTARCVVMGGADDEAQLKSMHSDGFTLNWITASANRRIYALSIKGGAYKVGSFTQEVEVDTQAITGIGFQPTALLVFSFCDTAQATNYTSGRNSFGATDGTSEGCIFWGTVQSANPTVSKHNLDRAATIKVMTAASSPTTQAVGVFESFDADGFTLDWTTADATARQIIYLAIRLQN